MDSKARNYFKKLKKKKKKTASSSVEKPELTKKSSVTAAVSDEIEPPDIANLDGELASALAKFAALQENGEADNDASAFNDNEGNYDSHSDMDSSSDSLESDSSSAPRISNRKQKLLERMTVAELKKKTNRPELVEWVDVTAPDPVLLVQLKATRSSVPVPEHWQHKRKFLQNKRGIEKTLYVLPNSIQATGISEIRQSIQDKDAEKSLRQKGRDRMRARMGKMDIDYQKLYDAFFNWQYKPYMTEFGDVYYEGKENEKKFPDKKPGFLSQELRSALEMDANSETPPPWLYAMQRLGPPPGYPALTIPGVNAPIPSGAQWGFHQGGWGNPPVDMYGRPLYGDVFRIEESTQQDQEGVADSDLWGEPQSDADVEESESDSSSSQESSEELGEPKIEIESVSNPPPIPAFTLEKEETESEASEQEDNPTSLNQEELQHGLSSALLTSTYGETRKRSSKAQSFKF